MYAVLPMSFAFLVAYSYATQRFTRAKLFNIIVSVFLVFFATFAWFYPQHQVSASFKPIFRWPMFYQSHKSAWSHRMVGHYAGDDFIEHLQGLFEGFYLLHDSSRQ